LKKIVTVLGPIEPELLGKTITHEHLFIDLSCYLRPPKDGEDPGVFYEEVNIDNLHAMNRDPYGNRDNCLLDDVSLAVKEVTRFSDAGGKTIVDVTLPDIGRDVIKLKEVANLTGVNIVAGCGHYLHTAFPPNKKSFSEDDLYHELIDEITNGIDGTDVFPGIIGEIGTSDPIHPLEIKMLKAAGRAQVASGLAITVHVHPPGRRGNEVLDILMSCGVRPDRIILDHVDASLAHRDIEFNQALDYLRSLLKTGAYLEFDLCGNSGYFQTEEASWWLPSDRERAKAIAILCKEGYARQFLLSQDVGHKHYLTSYGGWGYAHVLTDFRRYLLEAGVSEPDIGLFLLDNPARILSVESEE